MRKVYVLLILITFSTSVFSQKYFNVGRECYGSIISNVSFNGVECDITINGIKDNMIQGLTITPSAEIINKSLADKFIESLTRKYNISSSLKRKNNNTFYIRERINDVVYYFFYSKNHNEETYKVSLKIQYKRKFLRKENFVDTSNEHSTFSYGKKDFAKPEPESLYVRRGNCIHKSNAIFNIEVGGIPCNIYFSKIKENYIQTIKIYPFGVIRNCIDAGDFVNAIKSKYGITANHKGSIANDHYTIWEEKDDVIYFLHVLKKKTVFFAVFFIIYDPELYRPHSKGPLV